MPQTTRLHRQMHWSIRDAKALLQLMAHVAALTGKKYNVDVSRLEAFHVCVLAIRVHLVHAPAGTNRRDAGKPAQYYVA